MIQDLTTVSSSQERFGVALKLGLTAAEPAWEQTAGSCMFPSCCSCIVQLNRLCAGRLGAVPTPCRPRTLYSPFSDLQPSALEDLLENAPALPGREKKRKSERRSDGKFIFFL